MSGSANDNNNNTKSFKNVTHVIFDLDGLLIDSEIVYEGIVADIAKSYGKTYTSDVRMRLLGTIERRSAEIVVNDIQLPITVDEYLIQYKKLSHERLSNIPLMKGAERFIRHLSENNILFCLATSSSKDMVAKKTANNTELMKLFSHIVCGSTDPEVKVGKPAPDIFLIAAARFHDKPEPEKCLVFEDSPNGVTAAVAAGMQVVMVPDERVTPEQSKPAAQVLKSLEDFKPELFGLPKFS